MPIAGDWSAPTNRLRCQALETLGDKDPQVLRGEGAAPVSPDPKRLASGANRALERPAFSCPS